VLVHAGAAEVIDQKALTGEVLANRILALAGDAPRRAVMARAAHGLAKPGAAQAIADLVMRLAGR
jgi:UDP-N-acetylglucosamine--N-acetylmuramyl-(pentapeptide) pyrophosphoryl-undecaprenol N-acetylglucosamine transferase